MTILKLSVDPLVSFRPALRITDEGLALNCTCRQVDEVGFVSRLLDSDDCDSST